MNQDTHKDPIHVDVRNLSKTFGADTVLRDVNITFTRGRIHGLVGRNGSGKSMLLKTICGFVRPTAGGVWVDGLQIGVDCDFAPSLGLIIETPGFLPYFSGLRNLQILAAYNGKLTDAQLADVMRRVGLDPKSRKSVRKYSTGMNQRLAIAQAIMEDPALLALDEPFSGLDNQGLEQMRTLLADLRAQGKTIILSSHSREDIALLCDTVCIMDRGVLTPQGAESA